VSIGKEIMSKFSSNLIKMERNIKKQILCPFDNSLLHYFEYIACETPKVLIDKHAIKKSVLKYWNFKRQPELCEQFFGPTRQL
jgi:hypothetical protein